MKLLIIHFFQTEVTQNGEHLNVTQTSNVAEIPLLGPKCTRGQTRAEKPHPSLTRNMGHPTKGGGSHQVSSH